MNQHSDRGFTANVEGKNQNSREAFKCSRIVALLLGPVGCISFLFIPAPEALSVEAWRLIALTFWMVVWWMSEAAPVPVTALLPIPMMPLMGIADQGAVTASYGNPLIFLFLGGFLIAAAMQRWNLHKRIALNIVSSVGTSPQMIVAGFMLATAFLSMWISNTATTVMMLAVGLSMISFAGEHLNDPVKTRRFGVALMLGIAYSASIGGVGTLIGTPPNALLASYLNESYAINIDFASWMKLGVPMVAILLPVAWLLLCKFAYPLGNIQLGDVGHLLENEKQNLGTMSAGEKTVLSVFILTAACWMFRSPLASVTGLAITDTSIALIAAISLFVLPASLERAQFTVDWSAAKTVPWGVLILFGGGLALAGAFRSTGLAEAIGIYVAGLDGLTIGAVVFVTIASIIFLTEITSNTATTATFLPILGAVSVGMGYAPTELAIPAALAASMAFMMPVATPPNAIVFSYEDLHIADMMKAGLWMNVIAAGLIYGAVQILAPLVVPG